MINSILVFALGSILTLVSIVTFAYLYSEKAIRQGRFASARFDVKSQEWKVVGRFFSVAQKITDIKSGRKPGAVKYID